ncbi:hypothetical protein EDD85DRAFT_932866 [Armillaria nabsnona]|nr:hypothetical protein EDD85DRAFT_932866 [Armillaria nabsnona]
MCLDLDIDSGPPPLPSPNEITVLRNSEHGYDVEAYCSVRVLTTFELDATWNQTRFKPVFQRLAHEIISPLPPRGISIIRTRTFLPPPLMTDPRPSHILSSISSKLQRDTFIWSNTYPSHLIIGINQRLTPVSSALIKRWTQDIMQASWREFHLCPVEVCTCGVLTYGILPTGPEIPMLSTDALPPGDGCIEVFFTEPKKKSHILMAETQLFKAKQSIHIEDFLDGRRLTDPRKIFDVPPSIQTQVFQRDEHRCCSTRSVPPELTEVTGIVPPYFVWMAFPTRSQRETAVLSSRELENSLNAVLMHKDLIPFFNDNAFSVDIDDNYRIVIFGETGSARSLLPDHMPPREHDPQFETFLRAHFHSSIRWTIFHGDIRNEYSTNTILRMMEELGVGLEDDGDDVAPMDDPRWQTMLGKEIWEEVIRGRIANADVDYDSEEYDQDD